MPRPVSADPLRRDFNDRMELETYLKEAFKDIEARQPDGGRMAAMTKGGHEEAQRLLKRVDPQGYKISRDHLRGNVTKLSPYIRHGVIGLAQIRDFVLQSVMRAEQAEKLISELAWRDYFQRVYDRIGDRVWEDQESMKTGWATEDYQHDLPRELTEGRTGLACMDSFALELASTGYLHNHARMWLASYVVHWLKIRWQTGARWFLRHLLDGDAASNNLSWQWVASAFSAKPYIFNRANLERYTGGRFCADCSKRDTCPFDAEYETLNARLFPHRSDDPPPSRNTSSRTPPKAPNRKNSRRSRSGHRSSERNERNARPSNRTPRRAK